MKRPRTATLTRRNILKALRENQALLDRYSVSRIALFGSFAKGRPTAKSDIDFLVEFKEPSFGNFMGLIRALEKLFGRRVDVLTPKGLESIRVPSVGESIRKSLAYV
ncbi:MAG: nucleotidyltransferase family protein [Rhodospirillales bacterium]